MALCLQRNGRTKSLWDVLQLLLERSLVEFLAERELTVDALLRDVEVLHVEEAMFADSGDEGLRELLFAFWRVEQSQVDGRKICPFELLLYVNQMSESALLRDARQTYFGLLDEVVLAELGNWDWHDGYERTSRSRLGLRWRCRSD